MDGQKLTVTLDNVGNPDFGQDSERRLPGTAAGRVEVSSLAEASRACRSYIAANNLGGGNWSGGEVRDPDGHPVARVSYNGRVWPPGKWEPGQVALYDPSQEPDPQAEDTGGPTP